MTRMTGPDCVVMCNLINTYIHTYIHGIKHNKIPPKRRRLAYLVDKPGGNMYGHETDETCGAPRHHMDALRTSP